MDLADEEMLEDDGMGGRLGAGAGGGGIISPYAYQPPVALATASGVGAGLASAPVQRHQRGPSYGQEQQQQQFYDYPAGNPNPISSGLSSEGGYPATPGGYPYVNPMGRGPSPGPSVLTGNGQGGSSEHSSSAYGGIAGVGAVMGGQYGNEQQQQQQQRSAKEMEAMGMRAPHVMNPDDAAGGYYPPGVHSQTRQAYLQNGPVGSSSQQQQQQQFYRSGSPPMASSSSGVPDALRPGLPQSQSQYASASTSSSSPPPALLPGSAVVVHQDGGRVVMRKGERVDEEAAEEGAGLSEIPPTYDSLVHGGLPGSSSSSPDERRE
ncbi:hypothetical protein M413DRAFT_255569 [Hebeloma cylindrosporum]|uniref:Uncharacterized protein n=1 Tax=Hebeloma cylindrosporum TaxID=76867 RepID=A0A0C2XIZ0_HEBCY|nr:hypothetical protein M413DRAFT_255569 [Hebeloma cylindrosporum h7]